MSPQDMPTAAQAALLLAVADGTYYLRDHRITTWVACQRRGWVGDLWEKREGYSVLVATLTAAGRLALDRCRQPLPMMEVRCDE